MKLGKLLAAGKSIMNGRTDISYRSSKQIYLPKFGSDKNPFKPEGQAQAAETMPAVEMSHLANDEAIASPDCPTVNTHAPIATEAGVSPGASTTNATEKLCVSPSPPASVTIPTNMPSTPAARETNLPGTPAASKRTAAPKRSDSGNESASTLQRLNGFLRSTLGKANGADKSLKNQKGTATQTELSLDSVKVVHNDLSDVDVEVVPIKSRSGAPELPAPKKSWEYVGERLFGVEAT